MTQKKTRLDLSNEAAAYTEGRNAAIEGGEIKYEAMYAWKKEGFIEHFIKGYSEVKFKSPEDDEDY
jgi:hypothetical protein